MHIRRVKNCTPSSQPLNKEGIRGLKKMQEEAKSPYLFEGERGPLAPRGAHKIVNRAVSWLVFRFRSIPYASTAPVISSQTKASTLAQSKSTSDTAALTAPCDTHRLHPTASNTSPKFCRRYNRSRTGITQEYEPPKGPLGTASSASPPVALSYCPDSEGCGVACLRKKGGWGPKWEIRLTFATTPPSVNISDSRKTSKDSRSMIGRSRSDGS